MLLEALSEVESQLRKQERTAAEQRLEEAKSKAGGYFFGGKWLINLVFERILGWNLVFNTWFLEGF